MNFKAISIAAISLFCLTAPARAESLQEAENNYSAKIAGVQPASNYSVSAMEEAFSQVFPKGSSRIPLMIKAHASNHLESSGREDLAQAIFSSDAVDNFLNESFLENAQGLGRYIYQERGDSNGKISANDRARFAAQIGYSGNSENPTDGTLVASAIVSSAIYFYSSPCNK
jgi:hypothetical protein